MSNDKKNEILKRVYDLINNGEGNAHLEVDDEEAKAIFEEAKAIFEEIRKMRESGEVA